MMSYGWKARPDGQARFGAGNRPSSRSSRREARGEKKEDNRSGRWDGREKPQFSDEVLHSSALSPTEATDTQRRLTRPPQSGGKWSTRIPQIQTKFSSLQAKKQREASG